MIKTADRYTPKVRAYAQYRWPFAPEAVDAIFDVAGLAARATVADIGAGTGMLSRHFIGRVAGLHAIEPNPVMRRELARTHGGAPGLNILDARSDATTLPDRSVDLIVVGRAIHWFPPERTRAEFRRILKPGGWLAILQVPCLDVALLEAIRTLRTPEFGWNVQGDKWQRERAPWSAFYGHDDLLRLRFPSQRRENPTQFIGRLTSLSPAPNPGDPAYAAFERAARAIFDRFKDGDALTINIATDLALARVAPQEPGTG